VIEHEVLTIEELELVDDVESYRRASGPEERWGLAPSLSIGGVTVERAPRAFTRQDYLTNFGDPSSQHAASSFARVTFTIETTRASGPYLIKILIPLLIILALAYLVFFVPARDLDVAVGLTVTSVLASIAFQLTVADDLPSIGYIVTSDQIFYLCYFLIMAAMVETVYTHHLEKRGREQVAARVELWARFLFPALLVVGFFAITALGLARR
jgi:Neurotransmitter-gated ion-channel transmembrane region.